MENGDKMNDIESDKMILNKVKQTLDYLYDIDMLFHILEDMNFYDPFSNLYPELSSKYLTPIDLEYEPFSEDSDEVKSMKPIEWFGEKNGLVVKDNDYFLISPVVECGVKYWYIDKISTNNLEMARKITSIFELLNDISSFRHKKLEKMAKSV
jgi:hypothetical protein